MKALYVLEGNLNLTLVSVLKDEGDLTESIRRVERYLLNNNMRADSIRITSGGGKLNACGLTFYVVKLKDRIKSNQSWKTE